VHVLTALRVVDPTAWRIRVLAALRAAGGCVPIAAEALGVSTRTLRRWREKTGGPRWPQGVHRADRDVIVETPRKTAVG
jgi:hypothetical protein